MAPSRSACMATVASPLPLLLFLVMVVVVVVMVEGGGWGVDVCMRDSAIDRPNGGRGRVVPSYIYNNP
jgi:hypothetical protein